MQDMSLAKRTVFRWYMIPFVSFILTIYLVGVMTRHLPFFENGFDEDKAKLVFSYVQKGKLHPDAYGTIILPEELAPCTKYGKAYVTRKEDNLLLVLLPVWIGKGSNMTGYLLSNRSLTPSDVQKDTISPSYDSIEINSNNPSPTETATSTRVKIERQISPTIGYVFYDND